MKKRIAKLIVSLSAVLSLAVGFSVTASADVIGGAGLLGGALGSLGVDLLAGGAATMAALAPWLNGDFSIVGALTGVADGYIKVGDNSVTIDGVEYESIFLDPSMAAELHTQAFDFITQKAITSNSSGILADGVGYFDGLPVYDDGTKEATQTLAMPALGQYSFGNNGVFALIGDSTSYQPWIKCYGKNSNLAGWKSSYPYYIYWYRSSGSLSNTFRLAGKTAAASSWDTNLTTDSSHFISGSFDYEYVAGVINADPLPATYGFQCYVPTQTLSQAGISGGTYVIDGGVGTDAIIELIQLLDDIYGQEQLVESEFIEEIVPPVPPQPIDTPLGEVPYDDFLDTFGQSVYGKLDSISDGIDTVGQVIAGQGTDVIEAVDTAGQSVVEELEVIGGAIDTAGQSVVDSVEESTGILEEAIEAVEARVDELVDSIAEVIEEIMTHPLDLFSAWLDRLPEIPAIKDIFDGIKRHVGIWHYVVEWLGCIGSFLAFFIGLFGDVAYCMVVPIYACVAGAICLAFYKRFAR